MSIHRKVLQSLSKKKTKKKDYKEIGSYKFKVRYDFDSWDEMMEQKAYLLSLGWEVRYESLKNTYVLRGYYNAKNSFYEDQPKGYEYRSGERHDDRLMGVRNNKVSNATKKESFQKNKKVGVK